jgi:hypothetical protein
MFVVVERYPCGAELICSQEGSMILDDPSPEGLGGANLQRGAAFKKASTPPTRDAGLL